MRFRFKATISGKMADGRCGHVFRNWSGTRTCQPQRYFEPSSLDDLTHVNHFTYLFTYLVDIKEFLVSFRGICVAFTRMN